VNCIPTNKLVNAEFSVRHLSSGVEQRTRNA
jgi:hypothetical protein